MDEDKITITDPNYREPMSDKMQQELKEYEDEKLRHAEQKENEILEASWQRYVKRAEKRKKFVEGIKKIFSRKNKEIAKQSEQIQR